MEKQNSRHINFDTILNFRDLGGYRAGDGKTVAWRRVYRCGEMHLMTARDTARLREELSIAAVIDLRGKSRVDQTGIGPLDEAGIRYYNVPLAVITNIRTNAVQEQYLDGTFSDMGEVYLYRIRDNEYARRIIQALEIIAEPANHPLVFHCNAGKDRSGIIAAVLLSLMDVSDDDIIEDYTLTARHMPAFLDRWDNDPVTADVHQMLPAYHLLASAQSMQLFLTTLRRDYGSVKDFLCAKGMNPALVENLRKALLA